jgi:hypothetical protein
LRDGSAPLIIRGWGAPLLAVCRRSTLVSRSTRTPRNGVMGRRSLGWWCFPGTTAVGMVPVTAGMVDR